MLYEITIYFHLMSPEAQNDIKMNFYDFYQINLYVFNKFQIYFINYSGF
jgi:hypothetical protein